MTVGAAPCAAEAACGSALAGSAEGDDSEEGESGSASPVCSKIALCMAVIGIAVVGGPEEAGFKGCDFRFGGVLIPASGCLS